MALDTYLVVFHHFDSHSLQKLEAKYLGIISTLSFIPALVFLFINTSERGSIYGSETVSVFSRNEIYDKVMKMLMIVKIWCSISPEWVLIRIVLYYAPVWCVTPANLHPIPAV